MSEYESGPTDSQPDAGIDAKIVHDLLLELLGTGRETESDERQIFNVELAGIDVPERAQGRKLWYCLGHTVLTVEPPVMSRHSNRYASLPGVNIVRSGSIVVDYYPQYEGLTDEEIVALKGPEVDDELMFELAFALTACVTQVKQALEDTRPIDTITLIGGYLDDPEQNGTE